jgi:hypothetical protein
MRSTLSGPAGQSFLEGLLEIVGRGLERTAGIVEAEPQRPERLSRVIELPTELMEDSA